MNADDHRRAAMFIHLYLYLCLFTFTFTFTFDRLPLVFVVESLGALT